MLDNQNSSSLGRRVILAATAFMALFVSEAKKVGQEDIIKPRETEKLINQEGSGSRKRHKFDIKFVIINPKVLADNDPKYISLGSKEVILSNKEILGKIEKNAADNIGFIKNPAGYLESKYSLDLRSVNRKKPVNTTDTYPAMVEAIEQAINALKKGDIEKSKNLFKEAGRYGFATINDIEQSIIDGNERDFLLRLPYRMEQLMPNNKHAIAAGHLFMEKGEWTNLLEINPLFATRKGLKDLGVSEEDLTYIFDRKMGVEQIVGRLKEFRNAVYDFHDKTIRRALGTDDSHLNKEYYNELHSSGKFPEHPWSAIAESGIIAINKALGRQASQSR